MSKYIDADKLRAEIERLKGICTAQIKANPGQTFPFVMEMTGYDKLLSFLDTLEESENEDLEKEIDAYYKEWDGDCRYVQTARHFAKWGAEHLADASKMISEDLEEAANAYGFSCYKRACFDKDHKWPSTTEDAFKAGAEWQARQLLQGSPMPEDTVIFQKGVEEGKRLMMKDALTIADIEKLHTFLCAIKNNKQGAFTFTRLSDEQYEEVLRRFNKTKEQ